MINLKIEPLNLFFFLRKEMSQKCKLLFKTGLCGGIFVLVWTKTADWIIENAHSFSASRRCFWNVRNIAVSQVPAVHKAALSS